MASQERQGKRMYAKSCVACQQQIHSLRRDDAVRETTGRIANEAMFPRIYRLIDRMPLCSSCLNNLPLIVGPVCQCCGRPFVLANDAEKKGICGDCRLHPDSFLTNRSLLSYTDWGKELVSRFKYRGDERLAMLFANLLTIACLRYYRDNRIDVITYIPLHQSRLQERGFNQSELLAVRLGTDLRVAVAPFLVRSKETAKLSKQAGRSSRYKSLQDAFAPNNSVELRRFLEKNSPLRILLIDDIFTTGATMRSCMTEIAAMPFAHPPEFYGLTVFR